MAINEKRPPIKETVGAQYVCFAVSGDENQFTADYEENVEKTEVVKSVSVSENSETTPVNASGKVYTTESQTSSTDISVEVVAFPATTISKMRSDKLDESGLIFKGGKGTRPFFAYGKVVSLQGGNYRYDWYPKCQLTANTDEVKTKEDSFSEQNDTLTINAQAFNDNADIVVSIESDHKIPEGLTEEKFFSKPILTPEDLASVLGV